MSSQPRKLTDLLDLTYLQKLQDGFANAAKVTSVIVGPDGARITAPSNWGGVCALCHDTMPCALACYEKTRELMISSRKSGRPVISTCPHGDFVTAAVPIIMDKNFLGSWIFGQLIINEPRPESMAETAHKLGLSQDEMAEAASGLSCYSQEVFDSLFSIVQTITDTMVELGKKNKEMAQRDKALQAATRQLKNRDMVLTQYAESSPDAMYICDYASKKIVIANRALCRLLDMDIEDIIGKPCDELMGSVIEDFCATCPRQRLSTKTHGLNSTHSRDFFYHQQGLWLRIRHQAISWRGNMRAQMVTIKDITQEHSMRWQLEKLAYHDNLTGLPNTNKLAMDFRSALETFGSPKSQMICFDLSSLRLFYDAYGKDVGNEMLKAALGWFQKEDFGNSKIFCIDSYEFCIIPQRSCNAAYVEAAARKIRERFEKPWQVAIDGRDISYVCNINVSILHVPADIRRFQDLQDLISRTLNSGRNSATDIYVYDEEMDRQNHDQIKLVLNLKESINNGMEGFSLHYQPIVKLSTGLWSGVEALCRWSRPGHGPVSPLVFIHEAESLGLINVLGTWVLDTAVRQAKEIGLDALDDFFLSVNISPIQMMDAGFADTVAAILEKYQYPGAKLNLEITESAQMTFSSFTMDMIAKLRAMGIHLALDDFGTGYSSFISLKNLPVDFLKTEREFILGIENDSHMQYFFYIMSEIAHAANMKFIAEGIETAEQLKIAKSNGADYIQGYYFSKPLTADDLKAQYEHFIVPDNSYIPTTADMVNIQHWLSGKRAYELTPALFNLMNRCMLIMITESNISSAFQSIFELVGEQFGVSRAFAVVREDNPELYSNLYEWCNEKVTSQKHLLQRANILRDIPSLFPAFKDNGMVIAPSISHLSQDMQNALAGQDIMAVALIPMWDESDLLGFVGFDKTCEHAWSPEEIVMLWNLAILMANTIKREKLQMEVVKKKCILDTVLQRSGMNAYVVDPDTRELLWVNDSIIQLRHLSPEVIGKKCHEVFATSPEPCPFCKISELRHSPQNDMLMHEFHSDFTGRDYVAYASMIEWSGGKPAFITYTLDVTDAHTNETQMLELLSKDVLTGADNRSTVVGKLRSMIQEAAESAAPLSVCYVNINQLNTINCRYGTDTGDLALFHIVQAIRNATQRQDVLGRLAGDSFLIIMPGCAKEVAKVRMLQAKGSLSALKLLPESEELSFSFGIADTTELDYREHAAYHKQLLALAEKRMREQKKVQRDGCISYTQWVRRHTVPPCPKTPPAGQLSIMPRPKKAAP